MDPKLKKITNVPHPKKQSSDINGQLISDKTLHQEQRSNISDVDKYSRSLADETFSERFKKKSMKQDSKEYLHKDPRSDVEFPPVAGLTFPSVKGAEGTVALHIFYMFLQFEWYDLLQEESFLKFG